MSNNQVFIGNIKKCIKYIMRTQFSTEPFNGAINLGSDTIGYFEQESIIEKKDATLIRIKDNRYIDITSYPTALDYFKFRQSITMNTDATLNLTMATDPHCSNCLFVDEKTLKPYPIKKM